MSGQTTKKARHLVGAALAWAVLSLGAAACDDDGAGPEDDPFAGGVVATFDVEGEEFKVFVTNESTIQQIFDLEAGVSAANIPNGPVLEGPGRGDHNEPFSWHMDPDATEMAEVTIEQCSGRPSFVEENLESWIDEVGRYCPWSAELVSLEDHR